MTTEELRASLSAPTNLSAVQLPEAVKETPTKADGGAQNPQIERGDAPLHRQVSVSSGARSVRPASAPTTLPHSLEAEQGVLGSIFCDPAYSLPICARQITPQHFFNPANQIIYRELLAVAAAGLPIDLVSFTIHLRDAGVLDKLGGAAHVTFLSGFVPSAVGLDFYLGTLREKYLLRSLILGAQSLQSAALEHDAEPQILITELEQKVVDLKRLASPSLVGVEGFNFDQLLAFDPAKDPTQLLGQRWQCQGFTALWAGPAGAGKSTLEMQLAIYWACGLPCFGIAPARPLKSLILQSENDLGDLSEQFCGVVAGIEKCGPQEIDFGKNGASRVRDNLILKEIDFGKNGASRVRDNLILKRVVGAAGTKFLSLVDTLTEQEKPDLVWIDPLFAFAGCDLLDAKEIGAFLREGLIPIAVNRGVSIHVIHHVGKPSRDNTDKTNWTDLDFQYLGFGSSEVQNSFRAVNIMLPVSGSENVFRVILSKRGSRAGAKSTDQEPTTNIYLGQGKDSIWWTQVEKPAEPGKRRGKGFIKEFSLDDLLSEMSVAHGFKTSDLQKHLCTETGMSRATFYRIFNEAKLKSKIRLSSDGWIVAPHGSLTQVS